MHLASSNFTSFKVLSLYSASDRILAQQQIIRMIEQNDNRGFGSW
jgi:hypothetical protein